MVLVNKQRTAGVLLRSHSTMTTTNCPGIFPARNPPGKRHQVSMVHYTPGRVHLFRAAERTAFHPDPTFGWGTLAAGGVEVHEVPGDHYSMVLEPQVRTLAERIRAGLDESVVRLSAGFSDNAPGAGERRAIGSAD